MNAVEFALSTASAFAGLVTFAVLAFAVAVMS